MSDSFSRSNKFHPFCFDFSSRPPASISPSPTASSPLSAAESSFSRCSAPGSPTVVHAQKLTKQRKAPNTLGNLKGEGTTNFLSRRALLPPQHRL